MALTRLRNLAVAIDPAQRRLRTALRSLAVRLPVANRVLDLGSGRAPYAGMFPHEAYVTADLLAQADVRCEAGRLPFARSSFDLVLCTEVLEHVPDPHATLQEIRRTLTLSGSLVLSTPLTWGVHEPRDFHRWTDSGLRNLLGSHGFTVVELRPRGGILLCLSALLLVVPWQVFGAATERRAWQTALFATTYLLLLPLAILLAALDGLDRRRHFTQGYVALCRPAP
jgi:SAM-dependent methyltransferase